MCIIGVGGHKPLCVFRQEVSVCIVGIGGFQAAFIGHGHGSSQGVIGVGFPCVSGVADFFGQASFPVGVGDGPSCRIGDGCGLVLCIVIGIGGGCPRSSVSLKRLPRAS